MNSEFTLNFVNRHNFPQKSILVVEDDLRCQTLIAERLLMLLSHQSSVVVSLCATAIEGFSYLKGMRGFSSGGGYFNFSTPKVIILDHDTQWGDGVEFLAAINEMGITKENTLILAASGIPQNNARLMANGASMAFLKKDLMNGEADQVMLAALGDFVKSPPP